VVSRKRANTVAIALLTRSANACAIAAGAARRAGHHDNLRVLVAAHVRLLPIALK